MTTRLPEYMPMTQVKGTVPAANEGSSTVLRPCFRSTSRPSSGTRRKALQSNCEVPSMTHVVGIPAYSTVSAGS